MIHTAEEIKSVRMDSGELAVFFIGQAGFIFKNSNGCLIAVDLYLSDCCERYFGFKRMIPKLISPDELAFDIIIATHAHYDHFDVDSMPMMMSDTKSVLYTSVEGVKECERLSIPKERVFLLKNGIVHTQSGIIIEAVYCDHGELAPDAVGILLKTEGKCVYITGDTSYRPEQIKNIAKQNIDLMIVPINGAFGNLNEREAVLLAEIIKPKNVIPCHFWNFAEHGGNPDLFMRNMKEMLPNQKYNLMAPGEYIVI